MEIEYFNSWGSLDLHRENAYWNELSGVGSVVYFEDNSSSKELLGCCRASFSSSSHRCSRCDCFVVLICFTARDFDVFSFERLTIPYEQTKNKI